MGNHKSKNKLNKKKSSLKDKNSKIYISNKEINYNPPPSIISNQTKNIK